MLAHVIRIRRMTPRGFGGPSPSGAPSPARRWLSRNLVVLTLVSFMQDAASEMVYP